LRRQIAERKRNRGHLCRGLIPGVALVTLPAASTVPTSADATILAYVLTLDDSITHGEKRATIEPDYKTEDQTAKRKPWSGANQLHDFSMAQRS
jgi:hypothetical protein